MRTRIAKDFYWEMGHRLPFHEGGCQNLHGHSYKLRVEIVGETNEQGMVMDYFDLKAIVQPLIDSLDHSFICDEADSVMIDFFSRNPMKYIVVPFSTTAENIAGYILDYLTAQFAATLKGKANKITIRVSETESTFAEVFAELT